MSDSDQTSSINYELLVEDSLRTVVRGALAIVQEYGLLGNPTSTLLSAHKQMGFS